MDPQHLNDSLVAWLMVDWHLISGKMEEEQKFIEPDELDLYIYVFLNLGDAEVCCIR